MAKNSKNEVQEKVEKLYEEARSALNARYYMDAERIFKQALEFLKEAKDNSKATECEKEIEKVQTENAGFSPVPAIDNHAHPMFRDDLKRNPGLFMAARHFRLKEEVIPKGLDDMIKDMNKANVEKALIMSLDTSKSDHWAFKESMLSNDKVAKLVSQYPDRFIGYGSVDPRREDAVEETERCIKELGLKGMKFHPAAVRTYPNDEKRFYPIYEKCVEYNIPVQSHCGTTGMYFTKIKYMMPLCYDDVAVDFPTLKLVLLHYGVGGWHDQAMSLAFRHPNVYLDISGASPRIYPQSLVASTNTPFYQPKILFGTDYPFVGMQSWFKAFKQLKGFGWSEETQRKVLRENFIRLHDSEPVSPLDMLRKEGIDVPRDAKR
ncbi:MAG: amidohydrolase family protein [Thermodesulfobacteriota bacterium]